MRVAVVWHQHDTLGLRVHLVRELAKTFGIILLRPSIRHRHVPLTGPRLKDQEEIGHAVANILTVLVSHRPGSRRDRRADLADPLLAGLLQAHHRTLGVLRPLVHCQHLLPLPDKLRVGLGRKAPRLAPPRFEFVFFSVRRTVWYEIGSTYAH